MVFSRQWLLILFALILGGEITCNAGPTKEERAYAAAASAFQDELWSRAEMEFAQFTQKFPKSTNAPSAVLYQAEALYKLNQFTEAITLLNANSDRAGALADQYVYWIGEAQFQGSNYLAAADTFAGLARDFPGSSLRLRAVVESAAARAQLADWPQVIYPLQDPNGVFQRALQTEPDNELVLRGQMLLAHAEFMQKNFDGAAAVLESRNPQALRRELAWPWAYLLYQVKLAAGDINATLAATTNLMQIAQLKNDGDLRAESVTLHAEELENLNRTNEAIAAYRENLTNAPVKQQREAILKIAELEFLSGQFTDAEQSLTNFLAQFPESVSADIALLTVGELHLKNYAAQPSATNELLAAQANFDQFLGAFTNSPLAGRAWLGKGWCLWFGGDFAGSLNAFAAATQRLPFSKSQLVARFKWADAQSWSHDFSGAITNYDFVVNRVRADAQLQADELVEPALYQWLRAALGAGDEKLASDALTKILDWYPNGFAAERGLLLAGENVADPKAARDLFEKFQKQLPASALRPEMELAVARTYEREQNWPAVVGKYEDWLKEFPTNDLVPQVDYALAWADFQAGNETNALAQFTNFVAQFPAHELAPLAQWWVADHYFRAGDFYHAEYYYKVLFQTWPASDLAEPARLMAGHAAMGRPDYTAAIQYFTGVFNDTNCPPDWGAQARFAYGSALMRQDSPDTNKPLANFKLAASVFEQLPPTNELGAQAWIEMGKCNLQLTNYDDATNAYAQVVNSTNASVSARSQAQIGLGIALEKKAALATGPDRIALLQFAFQNYYDVLYGNNLRSDELQPPLWTKKAGLQAVAAAESLGDWRQVTNVCARLKKWLPQLNDALNKKIAAANTHLAEKNN